MSNLQNPLPSSHPLSGLPPEQFMREMQSGEWLKRLPRRAEAEKAFREHGVTAAAFIEDPVGTTITVALTIIMGVGCLGTCVFFLL
jgi:hypothetical protein